MAYYYGYISESYEKDLEFYHKDFNETGIFEMFFIKLKNFLHSIKSFCTFTLS